MREPKTLQIYPNPWHGGLDHNERPKGATPYPHNGNPRSYSMRWVGATPAKDADGEQHFVFDCLDPSSLELVAKPEPITVQNDVHQGARWKQAIRHGEVLAADADTYKAAFGDVKGFLPIATLMAEEKAAALKAHLAHGNGAADPKPYSKWADPSAAAAEAREGVPIHVQQTTPKTTPAAAPQATTPHAAGGN